MEVAGVSLPVLDELVADYATAVATEQSGQHEKCRIMRAAFAAGDVDAGLGLLREVCPAAIEDVRLLFRARKQKFVELLRRGGDPESALACARSELAPLALDAYPEAYGEFKRLLLLLLEQQHHNQQQQGTTTTPPPQKQQQPQGGAGGQQRSQEIVPQQEVQGEVEVEGGRMDVDAPGQSQEQQQQQRGCAGGGGVGGGGVVGSGLGSIRAAEDAAQASSSEFADLAYFTVRNMLGLQHPRLGLLLRYLLRLHASHPALPPSHPAGLLAAELAPCLMPHGGVGPGARDPPPLPPLTSGGGGPPSYPEADVQAVIQAAGTPRAAALEALRHAGGDALSAFQAEVGRLRLDEQLVAELALEYGSFRGLLTAVQTAALEARRGGHTGAGSTIEAAGGVAAAAEPASPPRPQQHPQLPTFRAESASPPAKLPRWASPGGQAGAGTQGMQGMQGRQGPGALPPGAQQQRQQQPEGDASRQDGAGACGSGGSGGGVEAGAGGGLLPPPGRAAGPSAAGGGGTGQQPGEGQGQHGQRLSGQEVLVALLKLAQEGDADGVLALVNTADPGLWSAHPHLLFDLHCCRYGKLLADGEVAGGLELARRELTPLASQHPSLMPALKQAMAALLPAAPPPPPVPGAANPHQQQTSGPPSSATASSTAISSSSPSSLLPSLPAVAGAIQAALQPRLGLQGPRLIRLLQALLASHRVWVSKEKFADPFAGPLRISALREKTQHAAPSTAAAAAAVVGAPEARLPGPFAPRLRVPPPPRNRGWFGAAAPPNANPQGLGTGAGAGAGGGVLEEVDAMASDEFDDDSDGEEEAQARLAAILGARADRAAAQGIGGTGGLGAGAAAGMEGMEEGDGEEGLGVEVEVDEEGVLQLMEILELPRSAAIELLQSHEGDVQAAVLSVMS